MYGTVGWSEFFLIVVIILVMALWQWIRNGDDDA